MHFGPRPKTALLSSASCQLGRQRDIGAVVNIGKASSVGFWPATSLPLSWSHQPHLHFPWPYGLNCPIYSQLLICSAVEQVHWKTRKVLFIRARDFSLKYIHSLAGNLPNKVLVGWLVPLLSALRGALFLWGDMGGIFHLSPQLLPPWSSMEAELSLNGGAGRWQQWHCLQHWPRWGVDLVLVLFQLFATSFLQGWQQQKPCLEPWPVVRCPLCQFIAKTSEHFPIILA